MPTKIEALNSCILTHDLGFPTANINIFPPNKDSSQLITNCDKKSRDAPWHVSTLSNRNNYSAFLILHSQLHHQSAHKAQDSVELRQSGVNQRVGEHVVTLAHADDTVGANLTLTDGRNHADQAHAEAHAEDDETLRRVSLHLAQQHEECHKAVDALRGRQCRQHHEIARCLGTFLETAFGSVARRRSAD